MKIWILFISFLLVSDFNNINKEEERIGKGEVLEKLAIYEKKKIVLNTLSEDKCECKGIKLYGKVKFVTNFPDIKIKYVSAFPDIKVKFVDMLPNNCGEWQIVENFPDFTVQIVDDFPDIKVQQVENFPGMN